MFSPMRTMTHMVSQHAAAPAGSPLTLVRHLRIVQ